jgi:PAS domain-containing protein
MLEFLSDESRLIRFIESRLHCGLMQRVVGADEMIWSRGVFALLDLDPEAEKPSLSLLRSLQHPEDRITFEQAEANLAAAKPFTRKYRVIRRDGTMRVLAQNMEFLFDAAGKPNRSIGVVCDITDAVDVEVREKAFERRFEAITRDSGLILNVLRPDGFVTGIIGGGPEHDNELNRRLGYLWHELIHPLDKAETLEIFAQAVREKIAVAREHRIMQPDGHYRWRRSTWTPVFDESRNLKEFVSISQDIEKEKTMVTAKEAGKPISGAQVRAGRALVRWSVQKLANMAKVSPSVVRRIEEFDGVTAGVIESLGSIRDALGAAGVEFIFPATGNTGVRLV